MHPLAAIKSGVLASSRHPSASAQQKRPFVAMKTGVLASSRHTSSARGHKPPFRTLQKRPPFRPLQKRPLANMQIGALAISRHTSSATGHNRPPLSDTEGLSEIVTNPQEDERRPQTPATEDVGRAQQANFASQQMAPQASMPQPAAEQAMLEQMAEAAKGTVMSHMGTEPAASAAAAQILPAQMVEAATEPAAPDRRQWLEERGWEDNVREAKWEKAVRPSLQAFHDREGHLRVPQTYVTSDGYRLGQVVMNMRLKGSYLVNQPDRQQWLKKRGFKMHVRDPVKDERRWAELEHRYPIE